MYAIRSYYGFWTGDAVNDGYFVPENANTGNNSVYYNLNDGTCQNTYEFNINVFPYTQVEVSGIEPVITSYSIHYTKLYEYGYGVGIDDLSIITGSFCSEPKGISFVNVKETSALIRWQQTGNDSFEAEYGVSGFVPGTGTRISNINDAFLQINGLDPWIEYDFYLRSYCSA